MKKNLLSFCVFLYTIIFFTPATAQWQPTGSIDSVTINCIAGDSTTLFAGTDAGMYVSLDSGATWLASNNGLTSTTIYSIAINGNNVFAGTYNGGIFLSNNKGETWNSLNAGLLALDSAIPSVPFETITVSGNNVFAGTFGEGVVMTNNNGASWTKVNNGLRDTSIFAMASIGGNIFAATSGDGMYISTDTGASWTGIDSGLTNANINALAISGNTIFAATGTGVFMSSNNGTSWTGINTGLTSSSSVYALAAFGTNVFAGTPGAGVFLTTNNGAGWASADAGLPSLYIPSLATIGNTIYAGTQGDGVWKQPLSDLLAVDDIAASPDFSIYPNPGKNELRIQLTGVEIATDAISYVIMNTLGQTIAQSGIKNPQSSIDVSYLPAGIYFLQLKSGNGIIARKFVKE